MSTDDAVTIEFQMSLRKSGHHDVSLMMSGHQPSLAPSAMKATTQSITTCAEQVIAERRVGITTCACMKRVRSKWDGTNAKLPELLPGSPILIESEGKEDGASA